MYMSMDSVVLAHFARTIYGHAPFCTPSDRRCQRHRALYRAPL